MLIFPLNRNVCPPWRDEIKKKKEVSYKFERDPGKLKQEALCHEKGLWW